MSVVSIRWDPDRTQLLDRIPKAGLKVPVVFGVGNNCKNFAAAGSMRAAGTILLGNGSPVSGSLMVTGVELKSPLRSAGSGIVAMRVIGEVCGLFSAPKKKNIFFPSRGIGPPSVPPK